MAIDHAEQCKYGWCASGTGGRAVLDYRDSQFQNTGDYLYRLRKGECD